MRFLTKKFGSFTIAKFEKAYKKTFLEMLDIDNLSIDKMLTLIKIGNNSCTDEEAGTILDDYLSGSDASLIDAYIQLLDEINRDTKILKGTGVSIEQLRNDLYKQMDESVSVKNDIVKPESVPDSEGFVTLD